MSAQPRTCPLTLDTLIILNSPLCRTQGRPTSVALWIPESPGARAPPLSALQAFSGWGRAAARRGGPASQVRPRQLPGRLISQHQQLLPQSMWHGGRTQDSASRWGRLESRSSPGTAGLQDLHGAPCGRFSATAQAKMQPPTTTCASLSPRYELGYGPWHHPPGRQRSLEVAKGLETPATKRFPRAGKEPVR